MTRVNVRRNAMVPGTMGSSPCRPVLRPEGVEPPRGPGLVASLVRLPVFPGGDKGPAHRGPALVDGAVHGGADFALQGDAPGMRPVHAAHGTAKAIEFPRHLHGYTTRRGIVRFGPVEGCAEICAAGSAGQAEVRSLVVVFSHGAVHVPPDSECMDEPP